MKRWKAREHTIGPGGGKSPLLWPTEFSECSVEGRFISESGHPAWTIRPIPRILHGIDRAELYRQGHAGLQSPICGIYSKSPGGFGRGDAPRSALNEIEGMRYLVSWLFTRQLPVQVRARGNFPPGSECYTKGWIHQRLGGSQ